MDHFVVAVGTSAMIGPMKSLHLHVQVPLILRYMEPHFAWLLRSVDRQMTGVYWGVDLKIGLHGFVSLRFPRRGVRHCVSLLRGVVLWLILIVVTRWTINEIISSLAGPIVIW